MLLRGELKQARHDGMRTRKHKKEGVGSCAPGYNEGWRKGRAHPYSKQGALPSKGVSLRYTREMGTRVPSSDVAHCRSVQ